MRVLMINDLQVEGGAEVQHWREFDLLRSKGHEVYSLTFDDKLPVLGGPKYNIPIKQNDIQKLLTRVLPLGPKRRINQIFNEVHPDLVHVNNVVKCPLLVYRAMANYPCVQTIRDYGAICPKSTCIHSDYSVCGGYRFGNCARCSMSRAQEIKSHLLPRIDAARRSAIDVFIAPSKALADACTANGLETRCLNNPFDFSKLPDRSLDFENKGFLYFGIISESKGVCRLIDAFADFSNSHPDSTLTFAGKVVPEFRTRFDKALAGNGQIKYIGVLTNDEMLEVLSSAYCVVVPSLWMENYPNTVLESLAIGVLVIGSNRGGIPELILDDRFLFDITDVSSMVDCMERVYSLTKNQYQRVISDGAARVRENNSLDRFYGRLMDVFQMALATKEAGKGGGEH